MQERRSCRIVQADVDIKRWMTLLPTVDLMRPARCPCCDAAGRPVNGPLVVRGHGLRERLVCGPLEAGGAAQQVTVQARRYRCSACGAIVVVVPRGLLRRRRYSAAAIGWVLARIGLGGATTPVARAEV